MLDFGTSKSNSEVSKSNTNILVENYFLRKNNVTSEGAVSQNVLYYQQLSIARYQVSFDASIILSNNQKCSLPLSSSMNLALVSGK